MTGFPHVLEFEEPLVTITWKETFAEVMAKVHLSAAAPAKLDPKTGGKCILKLVTILGLPWKTTFQFDPKGVMTKIRFERSMVEPDSEVPETLEEQLQRHGAAIAWRRAALEGVLGQGAGAAKQRPHPMMSARWKAGDLVVVHNIAFNIEAMDEVGYLTDYVEASRA